MTGEKPQGETDWDWKKWQRSSQREEAEKRRPGRAEERAMGHLYWVLCPGGAEWLRLSL